MTFDMAHFIEDAEAASEVQHALMQRWLDAELDRIEDFVFHDGSITRSTPEDRTADEGSTTG